MTRWRGLWTLEHVDAWVRSQVDRLRADQRARIAATFELGELRLALALAASLPRVAQSIELHTERCAHELLYAIVHECSCRARDARHFRSSLARSRGAGTRPANFPPSPSVTSRAPAARVSRHAQLGRGIGGASAAPQSPSSAPEEPARLAPWQRGRAAQ